MRKESVYKVVEKKTRHGSNMTIYLNSIPSTRRQLYKRIKKIIPEYLRPRYLKGRIIKAHPDTVGIMCFKTVENANHFICNYGLQSTSRIVKARGILRETQNVKIIPQCGSEPEYLLIRIGITAPPVGTIFCDEIEVLE